MGDGEFATDLRRRLREARQALELARAEGDFYLADVRAGELESLLRTAMEHGIEVPTTRGAGIDHGGER